MAIPAATLAKTFLILACTAYILAAMRSFLPLIYDLRSVLAWLRPPYVYFIINGIIVSIALSSRFQRDRLEEKGSGQLYPVVRTTTPPPADLVVFAHPEIKSVAEASFSGESELKPAGDDGATVEFDGEKLAEGDVIFEKEAAAGKEIVTEIACTDLKPTKSESQLILEAAEKPLVSSHFAHRGKQSVKSSPEGGGRGLGVARQKKQLETLESTWKSITEGRSHVQLTRRLKKSDAPENHHHHGQQNQSRRITAADEVVLKRPSRSPGVMILRKEPSLSQDELNRRVEAFIKKFNEEMRIQRQQSLQQYMETIKRSAN